MKKLLSLSLMLSLGLATVTPALNAAQSQTVVQSQANPADVSGWQAAKKWWQSGRNMKALSKQEKKAFRALKKKFTFGAIIAAIVAIVGGGAAYFRRNAIRDTEDRMFLEAEAARLIANGANVNDADQYGRTVLIRAAHSGHENIVKQLIEAGADVNAADQNEWTALMMAVDMGHENVVEKLLQEEGIEVNAQNSEGWTALMIAAYRTNHKIAELLLLKGADRTIQNERKKTAENIARAYKHNAIANMIRDFVLPPAGRTVKSAGKKGKKEENK